MNLPEIVELWLTPQVLHSLAVHFPVALALLGVPLVFAGAAIATHSQALRAVALICYALLAGLAFLAKESGERARELVPGSLPGKTWDLIGDHEFLAEKIWMLGLITVACLILSLARVGWLRIGGITLAMAASLGTLGWVALTAHYGGTLVYVHGVGVPANTAAAPTEPAIPLDLESAAPEQIPTPSEVAVPESKTQEPAQTPPDTTTPAPETSPVPDPPPPQSPPVTESQPPVTSLPPAASQPNSENVPQSETSPSQSPPTQQLQQFFRAGPPANATAPPPPPSETPNPR